MYVNLKKELHWTLQAAIFLEGSNTHSHLRWVHMVGVLQTGRLKESSALYYVTWIDLAHELGCCNKCHWLLVKPIWQRGIFDCSQRKNVLIPWHETWIFNWLQGADKYERLHKINPGITATKHGWRICHPSGKSPVHNKQTIRQKYFTTMCQNCFSSVSRQDLIFRQPLYSWELEWKRLTKMTARTTKCGEIS